MALLKEYKPFRFYAFVQLRFLGLRGVVVSEIGKGQTRFGQVWVVKSNASEPLMTCRNVETMSKLRGSHYRRISPGGAC